ncbi:MAG: hypothetical protein ACJAQU_000052 [Loktanella salsilacus]|jgi:hypothetical protein
MAHTELRLRERRIAEQFTGRTGPLGLLSF